MSEKRRFEVGQGQRGRGKNNYRKLENLRKQVTLGRTRNTGQIFHRRKIVKVKNEEGLVSLEINRFKSIVKHEKTVLNRVNWNILSIHMYG